MILPYKAARASTYTRHFLISVAFDCSRLDDIRGQSSGQDPDWVTAELFNFISSSQGQTTGMTMTGHIWLQMRIHNNFFQEIARNDSSLTSLVPG